jgi:hypothetical protein
MHKFYSTFFKSGYNISYMPKGSDWTNFVFINLGYLILFMAILYFSSVAEIKKNWPKYRCNPMYMPLSDNINQDFTMCVQTMQTDFMGFLLEPLTYVVSNLANLGLGFNVDLQGIRGMIDYIRNMASDIINKIFGIFINLILQFLKISMSLKDMMGKVIGIITSLLYTLDGVIKLGSSAWAGPFGESIRFVGRVCFHPNTKIKLKNGEIYLMKDLKLGSILENGAKVIAVMNVDNSESVEPLYVFKKSGLLEGALEEDIYVTGSHSIYYNGKYIYVKDHPDVIKQDIIKSSNYACLITSNHTIKIGKYTFWDWEDHLIHV